MTRQRNYIEADVLTEARRRMRHVFEVFDSVVVMFSGGKDSLAVLHLTREVSLELGLPTVNVVFRDEELIPDPVIEFVDSYRQLPWVNMLWFAVPLRSQEYILGVSREYVQWDPNRRHVRPAPAWAIRLQEGDGRVFDQYSMDGEVARYFKGKIALLTGIRAAESLIRYRSAVNKLNQNYITRGSGNPMLAKPIFDWEENDVFKYLLDCGVRYCPLYDAQLWGRVALRISTPLHPEAAKSFHKLKVFAPVLYAQIIDIFPEMRVHERYYRDLDRQAVIDRYGQDLEGVRRWIQEHIIDAKQRSLALRRLNSASIRARRTPEAYRPAYLLKVMMGGGYKREILPNREAAR